VIERYCDESNDGSNYSTAVRSGELIFVSGQLGADPHGPDVPFETQLRTALANLFAAVTALGSGIDMLLKVNGYIANIEDFPDYHRIYREGFGDVPRPARTTVQIGAFEPPILVEIDAIARVRDVGA
jgi:2-iminobutanoate/2-iminopropanoate deaminase